MDHLHLPPPPPYTETDTSSHIDIMTPNTPNHSSSSSNTSIIYTPPYTPNSHISNSAHAYFESRPFLTSTPPYPLLSHTISFDEKGKDFPEPWLRREVTSTDWDTFVNFLIPYRDLGDGESIEKGMGRMSLGGRNEGDEEEIRKGYLENVVREWNCGFFGPRGLLVEIGNGDLPIQARDGSGEPSGFQQNRGTAFSRLFPRFEANSNGFRLGNIIADENGFRIGNAIVADQHGFRMGGRRGIVADENGVRVGGRSFGDAGRGYYDEDAVRSHRERFRERGAGAYYDVDTVRRGGRAYYDEDAVRNHGDRFRERHGLSEYHGHGHGHGRGRYRHRNSTSRDQSRRHRSASSASSSSSSSNSDISLISLSKIPSPQLPLMKQSLQSWLNHPDHPPTPTTIDHLNRSFMAETPNVRNELNETPTKGDLRALREEVRALMRAFRGVQKGERIRRKVERKVRRKEKRAGRRDRRVGGGGDGRGEYSVVSNINPVAGGLSSRDEAMGRGARCRGVHAGY